MTSPSSMPTTDPGRPHHAHPAPRLDAGAARLASRRGRSAPVRAGAFLLLLVSVATLGAACSKSDQVATDQSSTSAPATTRPAADSAAGAGTTPGTSPGTTTGTMKATTSTTTKTSTSSSSSSSSAPSTTGDPSTTATTVAGTAADAAFCAKGLGLDEQLKNLDPTKDPSAMAQYKQAFAELDALAPPEVKADMEQINSVMQSINSFDQINEAQSKQVEEAGKRIDTWAVAHCGRKFGS